MYVKYMIRANPGVPLKNLLKNYDKKDMRNSKRIRKNSFNKFFVFKINNGESESPKSFQVQTNGN